MPTLAARKKTTPLAKQRSREAELQRRQKRYREDAEYRTAIQTQSRERYHQDKKYRKATLKRAKQRYHNDADYRQATIARAKARYQRLKKLAQRES